MIKRAGEKLLEKKEFLSIQYVPQPRTNGMTTALKAFAQMTAIGDYTTIRKKHAIN